MEMEKKINNNEIVIQKYNKLTNDLNRENMMLKNKIMEMQEYFEEVVKHTSMFEMKIKKVERENATLKNKLIEVSANVQTINEENVSLSKLLHNEKIANTVAIEELHNVDNKKLVSQLRSLNNMRLLVILILRDNVFKNINKAFHRWKTYFLKTQNNEIYRKQNWRTKELLKSIEKLSNKVEVIQMNETNLRVKLQLAEEACTVLSGL
jgi:hypothetical protein